jgi:hypothetical protein
VQDLIRKAYVFPGDANQALSGQDSVAQILSISAGVITAGRTLTNAQPPNKGNLQIVRNDTAYTITYQWSSGTAVTLLTGQRALIGADGTNAVLELAGFVLPTRITNTTQDLLTAAVGAEIIPLLRFQSSAEGILHLGGTFEDEDRKVGLLVLWGDQVTLESNVLAWQGHDIVIGRDEISYVQTTDATVTNLYTFTIQRGTTTLDATVTASRSGQADGAAYKRAAAWRSTSAPVTTQIGATVDEMTLETDGTWDVQIDNSTETGRLRVTGAAMTIRWGARTSYQLVSGN